MLARPRARTDLEVLVSNDGLVVYSAADGTVHYLNAAASIVFTLCDGARSATEIGEALAEAFDLATAPTADVTAVLDELLELDLLESAASGLRDDVM